MTAIVTTRVIFKSLGLGPTAACPPELSRLQNYPAVFSWFVGLDFLFSPICLYGFRLKEKGK